MFLNSNLVLNMNLYHQSLSVFITCMWCVNCNVWSPVKNITSYYKLLQRFRALYRRMHQILCETQRKTCIFLKKYAPIEGYFIILCNPTASCTALPHFVTKMFTLLYLPHFVITIVPFYNELPVPFCNKTIFN